MTIITHNDIKNHVFSLNQTANTLEKHNCIFCLSEYNGYCTKHGDVSITIGGSSLWYHIDISGIRYYYDIYAEHNESKLFRNVEHLQTFSPALLLTPEEFNKKIYTWINFS